MCSEELKLIAGENLKTVFSVHSRKEQNFSINRAYVELMQYGENIKQIDCEIDEHDIEFMLSIDEPGRYRNVGFCWKKLQLEKPLRFKEVG